MTGGQSLTQAQKLTVVYRVESGCLGPDGASLVDDFCHFAQTELSAEGVEYVAWSITPRTDKHAPELQFQVAGKTLSRAQTQAYLAVFGENLDDFEVSLSSKLTGLINTFMGR
ncbi:MAG: hypothetical protein ACJA1U_000262 [Bermanella sp.]|jgi:hypothetical protein